MRLKHLELKKSVLEKNFEHWLAQWKKLKEPTDLLKERFENTLFNTHSFPYTRKALEGRTFPYKSIFSVTRHNGILSKGYRAAFRINQDDDKSKRNIPKGLENYVFAYLGIHQPYYARESDNDLGIIAIPFGVFIKNPVLKENIETFPRTHASRRDLGPANEDVDQDKLNLEYLLAENARQLMAYQVVNDPFHKFDEVNKEEESFWHYYGNVREWMSSDYANSSWKKKAEFRYFSKIEVNEIEAVLWPIWASGKESNGDDIFSETHEDLKLYSKLHPDCKFITYDLVLEDPEISFITASDIAIKYYLEYRDFPENISVAKDILNF